ncbi:MAG: HDIG domain-containing protein [Phycisphaerales bacterium]
MSREGSRLTTRTTGLLSRSLDERRRAFQAEARGLPTLARLAEGIAQPTLGIGLVVASVFALVCAGIAIWTRSQPLTPVGRVMNDTRLVRVERIETYDEALTRQQRERERMRTPRVFVIDDAAIDDLVGAVEQLPAALQDVTDVSGVPQPVIDRFGTLDGASLGTLRTIAKDEVSSRLWRQNAESLRALLRTRPLLDSQTYQRETLDTARIRVLSPHGRPESASVVARTDDLVNADDPGSVRRQVGPLIESAGFPQLVRPVVLARFTLQHRATAAYDDALTKRDQASAAVGVDPVMTVTARGETIYERGDELTSSQAALVVTEAAAFDLSLAWWQRWIERGATFLGCAGVTVALAGYSVLFAPRIKRRAARMVGVAGVLTALLGAACISSVFAPQFMLTLSVLPTVFVAVLMAIGYDRRTALAYALLHGLLVCLCLHQGFSLMAVITTGVACVVSTLKEVRDRTSLVRTTLFTGLGLMFATVVFGLLDRPILRESIRELATDALVTGAGMLVVGGLTLFVLPLIERAFNVTTGLTLSELRDPKQPLLRELQMRAPGTYTHSLNVASLAETAAEAIGADSLLTYVGALYHDVGKMNKPEYFVENQQGGPNRHDKLSPAMSLLIVVGHVKDGMELAREFRLPVKIQHFIESHHGTTLVEYFYHRAKKQAQARALVEGEEDAEDLIPDEYEYRYPGPRPRTKEAAILMIADACESAARAIGEPTPAKIESLVREIANRRLRDGQFDDCELTLKELATISESVARSLTSMHHARVQYPGPSSEEPRTQLATSTAK